MSQNESPVVAQGMGDGQINPDQQVAPKILTPEEKSKLLSRNPRRLLREKTPKDVLPEVEISGGPFAQKMGSKTDGIKKPVEKPLKASEIEEPTDDRSQKSNALPLGMLMIALFVAVAAIYFYYRHSPTTSHQVLFSSYEGELEKMQDKYINQSNRFWMTFLSSLEPILTTDDPDLPAVIMMAIPDDHHSMALCFTQHVAEVLNKLLGGENPEYSLPSFVDGSKLSSFGPDEQKLKIDKKIRKIIESKQRTVIVSGLEKLHPKSILIFHGFCDNSEAVYKNIAIIFMLKVPAESNFCTDEEVYAYLFNLWNELGPGKTKALLARMANNVAIMQKVNHFIC